MIGKKIEASFEDNDDVNDKNDKQAERDVETQVSRGDITNVAHITCANKSSAGKAANKVATTNKQILSKQAMDSREIVAASNQNRGVDYPKSQDCCSEPICAGPSVIGQTSDQTIKVESVSPTAKSGDHPISTVHNNKLRKACKTTRVRINSTSENIQEPNWMLSAQEVIDSSSQARHTSLVKTLHNKLKSSISGSTYNHSNNFIETPSLYNQENSNKEEMKPTKAPVSILKTRQPTPSLMPEQINKQQHQPALTIQQTTSLQSTNTNLNNNANCNTDGQRKSGWKINNLLAKTISHLDDIRGQQRPVFQQQPTFSSSLNQDLRQNCNKQQSTSKFASVVSAALREQKAKKQQSETSDSKLTKIQATRKRGNSNTSEVQRCVSAEPTNRQQVLVSLLAAPSGGTTISSSLVNARHAHQRHSFAESSSGNAEPEALSARDIKLQQMNEQVLNQLRRQSNEPPANFSSSSTLGLQACRDSNHNSSFGDSQNQTSRRKADWARLTGKLAMKLSVAKAIQQKQTSSNVSIANINDHNMSAVPKAKKASTNDDSAFDWNSGRQSAIPTASKQRPLVHEDDDRQQRRVSDCSGLSLSTKNSKQKQVSSNIDITDNKNAPIVVCMEDLVKIFSSNIGDDHRHQTDEKDKSQNSDGGKDEGTCEINKAGSPTVISTENDIQKKVTCNQKNESSNLSSLVRKTSKVANFQQKLRQAKARRNLKDSIKNNNDLTSLKGTANVSITDKNNTEIKQEDEQSNIPKSFQQDVNSDANLIGDAIEIFLLSLQTNNIQNSGDHIENEDGTAYGDDLKQNQSMP